MNQQARKRKKKPLSGGRKSPSEASREFLILAGSWQDERPAREIAQAIRKSRRSGKRFQKAHIEFASIRRLKCVDTPSLA